ncbi:MAG TPA: glycosyltransferase family 87 protein [Croceibacterium sp.]|nr:glycosyltransferase family 87 protein [Croceibacterium sp.]
MTDEALKTRLATSRLLLSAILVIVALLAASSAVLFQAPDLIGKDKILTDFDAFYIAGSMSADGRATDTYDADATFAEQKRMTGDVGFMPWTYPPPYTLLAQGLASVPIGVSYFLFVSATLAFYLLILRRIAGPFLPGVLIAILPTLLLTVRTGQNGFLIGGMVGFFLLAFFDRRAIAGLPLGLMVLKPHLAVGISLVALLGRRWNAIVLAAAVVIVSLTVPTLVFGLGIWPAFIGGVRDAGEFLALGYYPLFRMTSVYAAARSFAVPAPLALTVHAIGALVAVTLLVFAWRKVRDTRILAATVCVASVFVSPYSYDYDLTILGVGIAFVVARILENARKWELVGLLLLAWFATGYGLQWVVLFGDPETGGYVGLWSLGAPALIALVVASSIVLRRDQASVESRAIVMPAVEPSHG